MQCKREIKLSFSKVSFQIVKSNSSGFQTNDDHPCVKTRQKLSVWNPIDNSCSFGLSKIYYMPLLMCTCICYCKYLAVVIS